MTEILVNIDVANLEQAVAFYTEAFDFHVGRRLGPHATELVGASTRVYLLAKEEGSRPFAGAGDTRRYARHWTPVHLDIVVNDIDAAVARAEGAGARREGEIETHVWGRIAVMSDPFGNGFCILDFLGRGYDEIAVLVGAVPEA